MSFQNLLRLIKKGCITGVLFKVIILFYPEKSFDNTHHMSKLLLSLIIYMVAESN